MGNNKRSKHAKEHWYERGDRAMTAEEAGAVIEDWIQHVYAAAASGANAAAAANFADAIVEERALRVSALMRVRPVDDQLEAIAGDGPSGDGA